MASPYSSRLESLANPMSAMTTENDIPQWSSLSKQPQSAGSKLSSLVPSSSKTYQNLQGTKSKEQGFEKTYGAHAKEVKALIDNGEDPQVAAQTVVDKYNLSGKSKEPAKEGKWYDGALDLGKSAYDSVANSVTDYLDEGKSAYDSAANSVTDYLDEGKSAYDSVANSVTDYLDEGKEHADQRIKFLRKRSSKYREGVRASSMKQVEAAYEAGRNGLPSAIINIARYFSDDPIKEGEGLGDKDSPMSTRTPTATPTNPDKVPKNKDGSSPNTGTPIEGRDLKKAPDDVEEDPIITEKRSALSQFFSNDYVKDGINDISQGLIDYAIGYGTSGGDQRAALAAGIRGASNQSEENQRRDKTADLRKAGLKQAQINTFVKSGKLSSQSENQLALYQKSLNNSASSKDNYSEREMKARQASQAIQQFEGDYQQFEKDYNVNLDEYLASGSNVIWDYIDTGGDTDSFLTKAGRYATPEAYKSAVSRMRFFLEQPLRLATGAVIGKNEESNYMSMYFPTPGQGEDEIKRKRRARAALSNSMNVAGKEISQEMSHTVANELATGKYSGLTKENGQLFLVSEGKDGTRTKYPLIEE